MIETFGPTDTWVNNATGSVYALFEETTPEEWRRVLVDVLGQVYGARVTLPHLRRAGGRALIGMGSVKSEVGMLLRRQARG